jgi:hypothetical protein
MHTKQVFKSSKKKKAKTSGWLMKTKSNRVPATSGSDDSGLREKVLETTNNNPHEVDEQNCKVIGHEKCKENRNYCSNNHSGNQNDNNSRSDDENTIVPLEIDTHFQLYGKHMWEVEYGERCALCNKRIDEFGFCACGSGGQ